MKDEDLILKIFYKKGLSIQQIEEITGIGKTTLYRIKKSGKISKQSLIKLILLAEDENH